MHACCLLHTPHSTGCSNNVSCRPGAVDCSRSSSGSSHANRSPSVAGAVTKQHPHHHHPPPTSLPRMRNSRARVRGIRANATCVNSHNFHTFRACTQQPPHQSATAAASVCAPSWLTRCQACRARPRPVSVICSAVCVCVCEEVVVMGSVLHALPGHNDDMRARSRHVQAQATQARPKCMSGCIYLYSL